MERCKCTAAILAATTPLDNTLDNASDMPARCWRYLNYISLFSHSLDRVRWHFPLPVQ